MSVWDNSSEYQRGERLFLTLRSQMALKMKKKVGEVPISICKSLRFHHEACGNFHHNESILTPYKRVLEG